MQKTVPVFTQGWKPGRGVSYPNCMGLKTHPRRELRKWQFAATKRVKANKVGTSARMKGIAPFMLYPECADGFTIDVGGKTSARRARRLHRRKRCCRAGWS